MELFVIIVNIILKGVSIIKRIIKYIVIILVIVFIIIFSILNNKKDKKIDIVKKEEPIIIENIEKMVYLIDKKNSNVDELIKDNVVVRYETVYICEEEEETTIEEEVEIEEENEITEEVEQKKGIVEIDGISYYFDDNYKLRNEFTVRNGKVYYEDKKGLQLVDGIRYYFDFNDGHLVRSSVKSVIDISSWQGDIDFDALKNSGLVDGVIVRVGYGTTLNSKCGIDNKFERNISELNRLGIPYGLYIYGYAQNEYAANIEANFVYDMIKKYNVNLYYPVFYDAELRTYNGVSYTKTLYTKIINTFTNNLESKGIKTGVYGNLYMLTKGSLNDPSIKNKDIWVAQYYNKCQYDEKYVGWQYSSNGNIPGISGRVDVNIFNY